MGEYGQHGQLVSYMQFLSLNVEGIRHTTRVQKLIGDTNPDVICLQEAPESMADSLRVHSYHVTFVPLTLRHKNDREFREGILIATRAPHTATTHLYHTTSDKLEVFEKSRYRETMRKAVLLVDCGGFRIATTHFTWTPNGEIADEFQRTDLTALLLYLSTQSPHIICGDFNIPRFHNELYEQLITHYTDAIPLTYTSSLDSTYHRLATNPEKAHLFTDFMVDYLLTQPPFLADDVELIFGISDHAAIVATLTTQ